MHLEKPIIVDLFLGSGNLLYHLSQETKAQKSIGFEINNSIFDCTNQNFDLLDLSECEIINDNYESHLRKLEKPKDMVPMVFVVDPPWGNGFTHEDGLNIAKTEPPVKEIMKKIRKRFGTKNVFFLVKLHEKTY